MKLSTGRFAFAAGLVLAAGFAVPAVAGLTPYVPPPGPSAQEQEAARLARFKFEPLAKVVAAKRQMRRISYADMWDTRTLPGVTIEKTAAGEVQLTVVSQDGQTVDVATLKPEAWDYVVKHDAEGLAPAKAQKVSNEICHGNSVIIESADGPAAKRREAGVCGGQADLAAMEYARVVAEVAAGSIPRCAGYFEDGREFSWILRECLYKTSRLERGGGLAGSNFYGLATGDMNGSFKSFAIKTANLSRAPISDDLYGRR